MFKQSFQGHGEAAIDRYLVNLKGPRISRIQILLWKIIKFKINRFKSNRPHQSQRI